MDLKDSVISIIKTSGPSVASTIAKQIGQNTIIASSVVSELIGAGKLKYTSIKFGSSPYYYLPEQIQQIEVLSKHLNQKDLRTFILLKEQKVLKDTDLDPLSRVSLQNMKDFAIQITVTSQNGAEIFWKYFLVTNEEAYDILGKRYFNQEKAIPSKKLDEKRLSDLLDSKEDDKIPEPKSEPLPEKKSDTIMKMEDEKIVVKKNESTTNESTIQSTLPINEGIVDKVPVIDKADDQWLSKIFKKFRQLEIEVLKTDVIRKNAEVDMILMVPSAIGKLEFYCKAKSKKKVNEGDLSSVYIAGQSKKLSVLFVTDGKLTKKAEDMFRMEFKNNFTVLYV
jgi:hypothetical protein